MIRKKIFAKLVASSEKQASTLVGFKQQLPLASQKVSKVHDSPSQWVVNKDRGPLAKSIIHPFNLLFKFVVKRLADSYGTVLC